MRNRLEIQMIARLNAAAPFRGDHPNVEALTAFRERKLPSQSREAVVEHLSRCVECREVLSVSAETGQRKRRPYIPSIAAAAAVIFFAGVTTSKKDGAPMYPLPAQISNQAGILTAPSTAQFSYAVADIKPQALSNQWRIRNSVLEVSVDMGRSWQAAALDKPFEAEEVRYNGSDVWVMSRSGDLLLSRDAGRHWTSLKPPKGR